MIERRRIYLVRHGAVSYFADDGSPLDPRNVPLTAEGRAQAAALAEALTGAPVDRAVCSGMPRARETAELALAGRGLDIGDEPRFREIKAGRLRDVPAERLEAELAYPYDHAGTPGARFTGGEAWSDFAARVMAGWADLMADGGWHDLFICAHDAVNRVILAEVAGLGLGAAAALEQDLCCLNILDVGPERAFIRTLNVTPYDLPKTGLRATSMEKVYSTYTARHSGV